MKRRDGSAPPGRHYTIFAVFGAILQLSLEEGLFIFPPSLLNKELLLCPALRGAEGGGGPARPEGMQVDDGASGDRRHLE